MMQTMGTAPARNQARTSPPPGRSQPSVTRQVGAQRPSDKSSSVGGKSSSAGSKNAGGLKVIGGKV